MQDKSNDCILSNQSKKRPKPGHNKLKTATFDTLSNNELSKMQDCNPY